VPFKQKHDKYDLASLLEISDKKTPLDLDALGLSDSIKEGVSIKRFGNQLLVEVDLLFNYQPHLLISEDDANLKESVDNFIQAAIDKSNFLKDSQQ